jgi:hypothetical protein
MSARCTPRPWSADGGVVLVAGEPAGRQHRGGTGGGQRLVLQESRQHVGGRGSGQAAHLRGERGRHRKHRGAQQQLLRGDQPAPAGDAAWALAHVPGQPLAPQWVGDAVPAPDQPGQLRAAGAGVQGADHRPYGIELGLHPLHPDRGVLGAHAQRVGQLGAAQLAGRLLPPQAEQPAVVVVQPAGRLHQVPALGVGDQLGGGALGEVAGRVGQVGLLGHQPQPGGSLVA